MLTSYIRILHIIVYTKQKHIIYTSLKNKRYKREKAYMGIRIGEGNSGNK